MKVLSDRTAADLVRLLRERPSLPARRVRIAHGAAVRPPMPFDCRVSIVYPNGEDDDPETHLFCYVPQSGWICQGCNGAVQPNVTALAGQSLSGAWLDCGEIGAGDSAWLFFTVSASNYAKYGHATPLYERPQAHVGIVAQGHSVPVPSGRTDAYVLFPHIRIATLESSVGLRQAFHGIYADEAAFGDDALTGNGWGGTGLVRSLSIATCDYNGTPGVVSLHGFRWPTTIQNPYASGGTAPSSDTDIMVLVRVLSSDGATAELMYMPLAELAPSDIEPPEPYEPPDELDDMVADYNNRIGIPCPTGHDNTQQLAYVWNPCDLYDGNGNLVASAGWQTAHFWPIGGDHLQCNGSSIGASSGILAIDLDNLVLKCGGNNGNDNWETDGHFSAGGHISAGGDIVARGKLVSLSAIVVEQNNTSHTFLPTQITIGGQTMTVLAEQQP